MYAVQTPRRFGMRVEAADQLTCRSRPGMYASRRSVAERRVGVRSHLWQRGADCRGVGRQRSIRVAGRVVIGDLTGSASSRWTPGPPTKNTSPPTPPSRTRSSRSRPARTGRTFCASQVRSIGTRRTINCCSPPRERKGWWRRFTRGSRSRRPTATFAASVRARPRCASTPRSAPSTECSIQTRRYPGAIDRWLQARPRLPRRTTRRAARPSRTAQTPRRTGAAI